MPKDKIKTLFLGSNWEAVAMLKTLQADPRFELVGIITQPDKAVGRKKEVLPNEVKQFGLDHGIEVFHTENEIERYKQAIKQFSPDLIICKSFGEIIPDFFLQFPIYKAINVHFSLLPKYRGAIPIQKAIIDGEKVTGITIMLMAARLDAGDILAVYEEPIHPDDTNLSLRERLVQIAQNNLPDVVEKWTNGEIAAVKQDDSLATYCWQKEIAKENAKLDWQNDAPELIERKIRAFIPWPVAWTEINGKRAKIYSAKVIEKSSKHIAGEIFTNEGKLFIKSNNPEKALEILELQIEGKNRVTGKDFAKGLRNEEK